jgi:hypothetical protein
MINATNDSKPRELVPSGNHIARCFSMVQIGTVLEETKFGKKKQSKVRITWELPLEKRVFDIEKGEQPMVISKEYTLSMYEKANLRKELEGWRGLAFKEEDAKSFDITKLLGIPCMLSIIHGVQESTGKSFAKINSIAGLPKGTQCPDQCNSNFEFNFQDKFDLQILESMPDFIKNKIKTSDEFKAITNPQEQDLTHNEVFDINNPDPETGLPF